MHNVLHTAHKQQMHIEWAPTEEKSRLLWPLYILVCVIQCVCQLHTHTHTHTNSYNTTHTYTQIYMTSLMVKHMLTHRYMPILGFSRLLLSYTCPLSSNTFCFILLPESSLSVQKTQGPMKRANLGGQRICTDSHGGSPASKWCTRGSVFLHPKETPEGIFPSQQLEKQSTKATAQLLPGPLGRLLFRVHRGWAEPGFTGRVSQIWVVPWASSRVSDEKQEFPHFQWLSCIQLLPRVVYGTGRIGASASPQHWHRLPLGAKVP